MNLSTLAKPVTLKILGLIVIGIGMKNESQYIMLFGLCLLTALFAWGWLDEAPESTAPSLELPDDCMRDVRTNLHHSQIPLFEQVMLPMMAAEFVKLETQIVGKTLSGYPISLFDKKTMDLVCLFSDLKVSRVLYQKRVHEERDRAITLLVFLTLFFKEQKQEGQLVDVLKKIPVQAYKLLRKEAYRLFDLSYLLTEHKVVVNHDLVDELSRLSLFNQYESCSTSLAQPAITNDVSTPEATTESLLVEESLLSSEENTTQEEKPVFASSEKEELIKEVPSTLENNALQAEQVIKPAGEAQGLIVGFVSWLEKRINSGNRQFALESQKLVVSNPDKYGNLQVFILPEVLGKYQSRSGVDSGKLKQELIDKSELKHLFSIEKEGAQSEIIPCLLGSPFECKESTLIIEGDLS